MNKSFFIAGALLFLSACGTIIGGGSTNVRVLSNVENADVYLDGEHKCRTPCSILVSNSAFQYVFRVQAEGYKAVTINLKSSFNLFTTSNISNLSLGGLTDLSTGGFWTYGKNRLFVILNKNNPTREEKKRTEIMRFAYVNYEDIQSEAVRHQNPFEEEGEFFDLVSTEKIATLHAMSGVSKKYIARQALKDMQPDVFVEKIMKRYDKRQNDKKAGSSVQTTESKKP